MSEMSQEEFDKMNLEAAIHTLKGTVDLVGKVEFELQDTLQDCFEMDNIDYVTIKKIDELNNKISVLKEAGNNMYERKKRLEHKNGYSQDDEDDGAEEEKKKAEEMKNRNN